MEMTRGLRETFLGTGLRPRRLQILNTDARFIADAIRSEVRGPNITVEALSGLGAKCPERAVVYLSDQSYASYLTQRELLVVTTEALSRHVPERLTVLVTDGNPRGEWATIANLLLARREPFPTFISKSAQIHRSACISDEVVISEDVVIGPGAVINGPAFVGQGVKIGSNSVVGDDGFEVAEVQGRRTIVSHLGGVWLDDYVEIHATCTIDKGMLGDFTFLGTGTMLDNQVHVAHSVEIGTGCTLTACVEISGSVTIGDNVWLSPQSCVMNGVTIGHNAFVGLGAAVRKDVLDHQVIVGSHQGFGWRCLCGQRFAGETPPDTCSCGLSLKHTQENRKF